MHVIVNKVQIREYNTAKSKKTMVVVLSMIHLAVLSPMTNPSRFTFCVAGCCDETALTLVSHIWPIALKRSTPNIHETIMQYCRTPLNKNLHYYSTGTSLCPYYLTNYK